MPAEPRFCDLRGIHTPRREARPSFRGLDLSEGTRGSGNPGDAFALETVAFSLAKVSAVLAWRTVSRGQGSSEIDPKLDRRPVKSRSLLGALWDQWPAWAHNSGVGSGFLPLLMPTSARHPPSAPGCQ